MHLDDIKILANNEKDREFILKNINILSQDIGMKFGIEKSH